MHRPKVFPLQSSWQSQVGRGSNYEQGRRTVGSKGNDTKALLKWLILRGIDAQHSALCHEPYHHCSIETAAYLQSKISLRCFLGDAPQIYRGIVHVFRNQCLGIVED